MRPTRDEIGLALARVVARRATCLRRQVGCVLTDAEGHVLATGYNGRAAGLPHCDERHSDAGACANVPEYPNACAGALRADGKRWPSGKNLDGCEAIHAEQNALLQCHDVREIMTCYATVSPCLTCVKLLMNTGCRRIVFGERYAHDEAAYELWSRARGAGAWVELS